MAVLSRRTFLIAGGVTGGALAGGAAVGVGYLASLDSDGLEAAVLPDGKVALNAWIAIDPAGAVHIAVPIAEIGQGTHSGCAQLVAEELAIDLSSQTVTVQHPDQSLPAFANWALALKTSPEDANGLAWWVPKKVLSALPFIATGGSTGIVNHWHTLRVAGASAREMLVAAAAERWDVPVDQCHAEGGMVINRRTDERIAYGELAAEAAGQRPNATPTLKLADAFTVIGKPLPRLDVPEKITGKAVYGMDVQLPDMLHAAIRHGPYLGGRIDAFDAGAAKALPHVVDVVAFDNAIAVIAERSYWYAKRAVDAIDVSFGHGDEAPTSSEKIDAEMMALIESGEPYLAESKGDVEATFAENADVVEATYHVPYLTHACMEPMNCTARYQDGDLELWCGTQSTLLARFGGGRAGVDVDRITVHVPYVGGGFGRRAEAMIVTEATALAAKAPGRPVKLIWSREDDFQIGLHRAASVNRIGATLSPSGQPLAWRHRIVTPSLKEDFGDRNLPVNVSDPSTDGHSVEGAVDLAYDLPAVEIGLINHDSPVPIGYWRANAHFNNVFASESFLDECAAKSGEDPYRLRQQLLSGKPRHLHVLDHVAEVSGWHKPRSREQGFGMAFHESFRSIVGAVVEVSAARDQTITIERVVVAIDCGVAINPDSVSAQVEGSVIWALSAALVGEITIDDGQIEQTNFHDYEVLRLDRAPKIETHIIEGDDKPGGVGEPVVPPIAPALANAVFAATGQRLRRLPLARSELFAT